jgi:antibiotic biosynthesis monooxygenase (ABM) superfamily enzyme
MRDSASTEQLTPEPRRYKIALLTWAGSYATITLILGLLGPVMTAWPLPLRTLLLSALMVAALTWLVIPSLTRWFRRWLTADHHPRRGRLGRTSMPIRVRARPLRRIRAREVTDERK